MGTGTGDLFRDAVGGHGCGYMADARGRARARVYFLSQISCTGTLYTLSFLLGEIPKTLNNFAVFKNTNDFTIY